MIVGQVEGGVWVDRVVLWIGTAIINRKRLVYQVFCVQPSSFLLSWDPHSGEEEYPYRVTEDKDSDRGFSYTRIESILQVWKTKTFRRVTTCPEHRD